MGIGLYDTGDGVLHGGFAQVIAGVMEFKKGNTFGTTAFTSYGFFWLTLVFLLLAPELGAAPHLPGSAGDPSFFFRSGKGDGRKGPSALRLENLAPATVASR